ncbi:DMT family transporter [Paractinoplanes lichenicola]|uniref:DMT family transporter n=1 Tax=Paractinoplanes lichenicola TaxID=2802976 RepID=A0ABS1W0X7_9ACTN|nr:DMT family transporter [Actinoplanes lichenicola]MBL7260390.1 DMT family transporter [Actinoplanes lichenicola]
MGSLGWAVTLSVLSAASYAAAAVAQERLAEHGQRGLTRWAVALLLTGGGVVLHVVALNFGTVAVVQALGTLTLLFALPIAAVRYRTSIGRASWIDAILTVLGLALILSLSVESSEPAVLAPPDDRHLALITLAVVAVLTLAAWPAGPRVRSVLLAAAAGVAFGIASVLSKAVLAAFTDGGAGAVSPFAGVAVLVFATGGYVLGQLSYGRAGLAAPLATVSVANPIVAATAGVVVFDESFRFGPAGLLMVGFAAAVMTLGVLGLARRAAATSPSDSRDDRRTADLS